MNQKTRSDQKTFWGIKANAPVFFSSIAVILALVISTLVIGKPIEKWFSDTQNTVSHNLGWFFILLVNVFLVFSIVLAFGRFGKIRIGGAQAKPEFSKLGWFSMLFSAGLGIGLLFWGVAEPIFHFNSNPFVTDPANKITAAKEAMAVSFLHWGLHAWSLYAIVGVALAFFTFNKKLPLTIRSIFHPIFGDKIYGPIGDVIDTIAVIATLFGLATSLGMGAQQVNAGLDYLFDIGSSTGMQIGIITVITGFATISLLLGLDKGIRKLSELNMSFAIFMLLFILVVGPTLFLLKSFVQNIGTYISQLMEMSFWTNTYKGLEGENTWQSSWTVFYWAWWFSWSPFVGIFIARISKGRTIKEFILGVLLAPSLLTFLWFTFFGGSAIYQELMGNSSITEAVNADVSTAVFHLLEEFSFSTFSSVVTVVLVVIFFVTSSDSGSYVVDTLTSGGRHDAPVGQKIFWASMEGLIASVLLLGGGLTALQTAAILSGIPAAIIIIVMCFSLYKSLKSYKEDKEE